MKGEVLVGQVRPDLGLTPVRREIPDVKEKKEYIQPAKVDVMLIGMQGEGGFSLHDPIAIGVIAKRVKAFHPDITLKQIDTQPELHKEGKINTDKLAQKLYDQVMEEDAVDKATVVGISMPIFSLNYTLATLEKYHQLCEDNAPQGRVEFVLGGSIPSHTDEEYLRVLFPNVNFVKGEGEERFANIVQQIKNGEEVTGSEKFEHANLQEYLGSDRELTVDAMLNGAKPKTEFSRGCGYGSCTFCSRPDVIGRGGKDYRNVPEGTIIQELRDIDALFQTVDEVISTQNPEADPLKLRFEITDEDAFSFDDLTADQMKLSEPEQQQILYRNAEKVVNLVSALKSAQEDPAQPMRRIPFAASMRVDTVLKLDKVKDATGEKSLLDQLAEVGLDQVFLGVEGGSNDFLQTFAKGQRMEAVATAVDTILKTTSIDEETQTERPMKLEMGFIAFSYRMSMDMLRENIRFLSKKAGDPKETESEDMNETNAKYVSALFNNLEVRAGTNDVKILNQYVITAKRRPDFEKYKNFKDYDPSKHFNINTSAYEDVPFMDDEVARIYEEATRFSKQDANLHYTLKSAKRSGGHADEHQEQIADFLLKMKQLHLKYLRNAVGLEEVPDVVEQRRSLVERMAATFGEESDDGLNHLRREIRVFLQEEQERIEAHGIQHGATLVMQNEKGRLLLVRPRGQNEWAFAGGNRRRYANGKLEPATRAAIREAKEELGLADKVHITVTDTLPAYSKTDTQDKTTGKRDGLVLTHALATVPDGIDIQHGDHEIADVIMLSPEEIRTGKFPTKPNVRMIAEHMIQLHTTAREAHAPVTVFVEQ